MTADKFDDDYAALEDIANAPQVSPGEESQSAKKPLNIKMAKSDPVEMIEQGPTDERNARLLASNVNTAIKSFTGKELVHDQIDALSELATMAFTGLRSLQMPRFAYASVLGMILIIPAAPLIYKLLTAQKEQKNGN